MRPPDTLAVRLKLAREKRGLKQGSLADAAGMKQPDISKIERGLIRETTGIARLAAALRVPPLWLERGDEPEPEWETDPPHPDATQAGGVAQKVSYHAPKFVPTISWERTMDDELPPLFAVEAPDDSMAPRIWPGRLMFFSTDPLPRGGDAVLVADARGNTYVRVYRVRTREAWQAAALNPAYQELDSERDGLRVLAVLIGQDGRWTQDL